MKVLLLHPGASWSTSDVYDGLNYGLKHHGVDVIPYRLDERIEMAHKWLHVMWRQKNKRREKEGLDPLSKPTKPDVVYHSGIGAFEMAIRHNVDVVLVVSAMLLHPDVVVMMKRVGLRVAVLFTESPYDLDPEKKIAAMVDACWTNERTSVPAFLEVNARSGYLPHGWHPERHLPKPPDPEVPSHDVVFVGSGFAERIAWFNAIDWSGINLGLYGSWKNLGLKKELKSAICGDTVRNEYAAALYANAKVGLNLYRMFGGFKMGERRTPVYGESLSPRAYELAACGAFHISDYRPEVAEVFGDLVPTFRTPAEAEVLIRRWVADDEGRAHVSAQLPARVAEMSWVERSAQVIGDLHTLLMQRAA